MTAFWEAQDPFTQNRERLKAERFAREAFKLRERLTWEKS